MKRIIAVLLAVFVSCGAALIGCTSKEPVLTQAAGNEGAVEAAVNENVTNPPASEPSEAPAGARGTEMLTPEPTEPDDPEPTEKSADMPADQPTAVPTEAPVTEPGENEFIKTGFLKVRANGAVYTPVEELDYSKLWLDDIGGFIHADGLWIGGGFGGRLSDPEFAAALPRVPYDPDFGFVLAEGCSIYRIDVFDVDTHERIAWKISESELRQMAASAEDGLIAAVYVSCRGRCINGEYESWGNAYGIRLG